MMQPWQRKHDRETIEKLRSLGYRFEITTDGYTVHHNDVFVGGASVMLPREHKLHWRHVQPCLDDNRTCAIIVARQHAQKINIEA